MTTYLSSQPGPGDPRRIADSSSGDHRFQQPAEKELRVDADRTGSVLRLQVVGTVDYDTKGLFTDAVACHLHEAKSRVSGLVAEVRLDFAGLEHCDSSGLAALISAHNWTTAAGMRLQLVNQPPFLQRMLTLTGLAEYFADGTGASAGTGARAGAAERFERR
jgi:anti-anti-sigma factor